MAQLKHSVAQKEELLRLYARDAQERDKEEAEVGTLHTLHISSYFRHSYTSHTLTGCGGQARMGGGPNRGVPRAEGVKCLPQN